MKYYLFLAAAILCETIGTSFLKKTDQFTKPIPTVIFIVAMVASFYLLSHALKGIPIGISYAILLSMYSRKQMRISSLQINSI